MYKLLDEDIWFASHQALLLRIVETDDGKDLLCIPRDFPVIDELGKSHIRGIVDEDKRVYHFHSGHKFGNVIRHRWLEFQKYAKHFYDAGDLTNIYLYDQWRLAATTDTFYPNPGTGTAPVDGHIFNASSATWATVRNAATGTASDTNVLVIVRTGKDAAGNYLIGRGALGFDLSSLTGTVSSALFYSYPVIITVQDNDGDDFYTITDTTLVSNNAIVSADYAIGNFGTTEYITRVDLSGVTTGSYRSDAFNAAGIAYLEANKGSVIVLGVREGHDVVDSPISVSNSQFNNFIFSAADETGTSQDPYLEVVTVDNVASKLINGGLINNGLVGGRLI